MVTPLLSRMTVFTVGNCHSNGCTPGMSVQTLPTHVSGGQCGAARRT